MSDPVGSKTSQLKDKAKETVKSVGQSKFPDLTPQFVDDIFDVIEWCFWMLWWLIKLAFKGCCGCFVIVLALSVLIIVMILIL